METFRFIIFPIVLSAGAGSVVSFLWYAIFLKKNSPAIKEEALDAEYLKEKKNIFRISFVSHVFSALAIFMLIKLFQIKSFSEGLQIIFFVWTVLAVLSGIRKVIVEKKSLENLILGVGHDFVIILTIFFVIISLTKS